MKAKTLIKNGFGATVGIFLFLMLTVVFLMYVWSSNPIYKVGAMIWIFFVIYVMIRDVYKLYKKLPLIVDMEKEV